MIDEPAKHQTEDDKLASLLKAKKNETGWWVTSNSQVIVLQEDNYWDIHWKLDAIIDNQKTQVLSMQMGGTVKSMVSKCEIYLKYAQNVKRPLYRVKRRGDSPGNNGQVDFSELPTQASYRCLVVLVDTYSGWPEAYPCHTNKAREIVKILLKRTPRFGVPIGITSDRGSYSVAKIVQNLTNIIEIG